MCETGLTLFNVANSVLEIIDVHIFFWSVKNTGIKKQFEFNWKHVAIAYNFTTSKSLNTVHAECHEIWALSFHIVTTSDMSRPQPRSHCREMYASSAPYQIPMPRRNTSWSSSPSRSSIPLTPRSICTMCCLYTLFLVGLVCACGAVFYLVEEFVIKDDTTTSEVISTTPVDVTIDSTTDCKTTKVPVKPTVKTTPTTTTTKEKTTTKAPTTTTNTVEDSSSCSNSNSTTESSTSKYRISTNSSSSETTTHPHPPLNESNYVSGNSTTADSVTTPTESCTNDTDDSITTASLSSGSKTKAPAKPSSQDKDESTSTDCSRSVEDTAVVNSLVVGENKEEESRGSERKNFL